MIPARLTNIYPGDSDTCSPSASRRLKCRKRVARYAYRISIRMGLSEDEARAARRVWKRMFAV